MVEHVYEFPDFKLEYERRNVFQYTDHRGRVGTISDYGFYDPITLEEYGLTTVKKVCVWWIENRETLRGPNFNWDSAEHYFDGYAQSDEDYYRDMYYGDNGSYPIHFSVTRGGTIPLSDLFQRGEGSGKPVYQVYSRAWRRTLQIEHVEEAPETSEFSLGSMWTNKHNYSYKMNPDDYNFFRRTKRDSPDTVTYGMELEISTELSPLDLQRVVAGVEPKQEPFFICKDDSSISGRFSNRLELVTVPATSRYLKREWGLFFKKLDRLARAKGKTISDYVDTRDNLNNGIHIHVSKDKFKKRHRTRFLSVWQSTDSQTKTLLHQLSGRPVHYWENQYCPIDRRYQGVTLARKLRNELADSRSVCHGGNSATLEVRIFQGIFDLHHVLRCLEVVEGIYNFTEMLGYSSFGMRLSSQLKEFFIKSAGYRHVKEMFKCA